MSKIYATDHFETSNWEVTFDNLAPNYADLFIGFTDNAPVVEFKDLKFSFELCQDGEVVAGKTYPPANTKYVRSDQTYLVVERLSLSMETDYELYLWAENDGQSFEKTISFTTPRPAQPYESWTWNGEQWNPPVPYPDDDGDWVWDEDAQQWVEFEGEGE